MGGVATHGWPKRQERYPLRLAAMAFQASTLHEAETTVYNISKDGCGITGDFAIGERVTVRASKFGILEGQVRWAFMGRAGVQFHP